MDRISWHPLLSRNPIRIMVVDDEPEVCRNCSEMLSAKAWEVETALNGKDGLARAQAEAFDVIVLDLELAGFAGMELLRELREKAPGTPVIAIIPRPSMAVAVQAIKTGACDCLAKPFSTHEMRNAVESALCARPAAARAEEGPEAAGARSVRGLMIRTRPEFCYACLGCLVACAYSKLGLPEDAPLRPDLLSAARLSVKAACGYSVPILCMQCPDAACMVVCPTGCLQRLDRNSPICADSIRCIGCRSCVLACPIGVLTLDIHNRAVQKCDLCISRIQKGRWPACVESCPMDALELVRLDALTDQTTESAARHTAAGLEAKERGRSRPLDEGPIERPGGSEDPRSDAPERGRSRPLDEGPIERPGGSEDPRSGLL